MARTRYKKLGIDVYIEVNNRKLLEGFIIDSGIPSELSSKVILSVDKLAKIGETGVKEERKNEEMINEEDMVDDPEAKAEREKEKEKEEKEKEERKKEKEKEEKEKEEKEREEEDEKENIRVVGWEY